MCSILAAGSINLGLKVGIPSTFSARATHLKGKERKSKSLLKNPVGKAHGMVNGAGDLVQLIPGHPSQHLHIIHLLLLPFLSFLLYFNAKPDTPFGKRHFPGFPCAWEHCVLAREIGKARIWDQGRNESVFHLASFRVIQAKPGPHGHDLDPASLEITICICVQV